MNGRSWHTGLLKIIAKTVVSLLRWELAHECHSTVEALEKLLLHFCLPFLTFYVSVYMVCVHVNVSVSDCMCVGAHVCAGACGGPLLYLIPLRQGLLIKPRTHRYSESY